MVICSYLLLSRPGSREALARRLSRLPGCEVVRATNRDALLLVVESGDATGQEVLREEITGMPDVQALALTFGQVDGQVDGEDRDHGVRATARPLPMLEPAPTP